MNWVPLLFIDDVCHQLRKPEFNPLSQLSGSWPSFGSEHRKKRRELKFRCAFNGNQEVKYCIWETDWPNREVTVTDLNLEFDRITVFYRIITYSDLCAVSLREFERDILPTIVPLVTNCSWPHLPPTHSDQNRIFFNAFKNFPGFNSISVQEQGQESRDFLSRQVELGNVQTLNLLGKWPEPEKLVETLKIFMSSTRFHSLYSLDPLRDDYELFELFLDRALAKELKRGAYISAPGTNLDKNRLLALHPEFRHDSKKISDSITLRHLDGRLYVRVE